MTRKTIHMPGISPERWSVYYATGGTGELSGENDDAPVVFTEIRDRLRTPLELLGLKVSDIGVWVGSVSYTGMIFEIHNPSTNRSWYVISGYRPTNVSPVPDIDDYLGGSPTDYRTLVKAMGAALTYTTSPANGIVFSYNPDTTISRADLDHDDANLRYTGGDFTSLTTVNPDTLLGLQAIIPSHCPYGIDNAILTAASENPPWSMTYDSEEEAFLICQRHTTSSYGSIVMLGEIITPTNAGDTSESGLAHIYGDISSAAARGYVHTYAEVSAFDTGGTRRDYDIVPTEDINVRNYKVVGGPDDGKLDWRPVPVTNGTGGSGAKGFLKEALACEIGIYGSGHFYSRAIKFPDAAHTMVCYTVSMAFFWEDGIEKFPGQSNWNP